MILYYYNYRYIYSNSCIILCLLIGHVLGGGGGGGGTELKELLITS